MIPSLFTLLAFQLVGEITVRALRLPLPGPVLGMVLLAVALGLRGGPPEPLGRIARGLLDHLSLLFIPAGVGIIAHLSRVADEWLAITVTILASTAVTLVVSAATLSWLMRRLAPQEE
ncbi:Holin-like protein CidA [wastewater metagenome]|uniref:Holin-like protein CidA n=2 Tax=unclassified sequences TaxID=12908 RepID=A0A5B8RFB7_9ZZZZ|nr:CidA/LrgA family protein [Arhodomonas aquaeolei]MCS4504827.1 CidA/LrgA family protein [Arhodomonas aquaeolei]QEA07550.1 holin-like protein CidA [uncultured organism]